MTDRQKLFAVNYAQSGDAGKSAVMAGYCEKNAEKYAEKMLENEEILQHIKSISKAENHKILTTGQCKAVLSQIVCDEDNTPSERIKAIDLLIGIDDDNTAQDNNISISINYGVENEDLLSG